MPCNQFGGQEPGTPDEIAEFCSATYGVTFPMTEKVEVNGPGRHPVYDVLTATSDADGEAGDVQWNFEKFLLAADGAVVARYRPQTEPDDPDLVADVEMHLLNSRATGDRSAGASGPLPDADAVLGVEPQAVARLGVERLVELVEVAGDVGAELRR